VRGVQATVRCFDADSRSGTVLLDDGTELAYDTAAFDAGGLRLLRSGQRVALRVATEPGASGRPVITVLTLATLPLPEAPSLPDALPLPEAPLEGP
jgi:cold shock CspA family protein